MSRSIYVFLFLYLIILGKLIAQRTIDSPFSRKKMKKDLIVFNQVREAANSGVYKYRAKSEIDSIYQWAESQIDSVNTYREFYKIICSINSFEGSLHNELFLPKKVNKALRSETVGYFPYPIKVIGGEITINYQSGEFPLGSQIMSIDGEDSESILKKLYKYYPTDGFSINGKKSGIDENFSKYYRLQYGQREKLSVVFENSGKVFTKIIPTISYKEYYNRFEDRHSRKIDRYSYQPYKDLIEAKDAYMFDIIDSVGILTINSFLIGWHKNDPKHKKYLNFLDSTFLLIKEKQIENLIVDIRHNGGGSDPNDMVTYSYFAKRDFLENTDAWISFQKIPYWKYIRGEVSFFMRPIEKYYSNKSIKRAFPIEKESKFYQSPKDQDKIPRNPNSKSFHGNVYLLIGPRTASAGSLFGAMLASNENTTVIGEETQGGYYGHNGHIPIRYRLPKSKIKFMFSIVNLEQDVTNKENQPFGSGVMPDILVHQSREDFIENKDTILNYAINTIKSRRVLLHKQLAE